MCRLLNVHLSVRPWQFSRVVVPEAGSSLRRSPSGPGARPAPSLPCFPPRNGSRCQEQSRACPCAVAAALRLAVPGQASRRRGDTPLPAGPLGPRRPSLPAPAPRAPRPVVTAPSGVTHAAAARHACGCARPGGGRPRWPTAVAWPRPAPQLAGRGSARASAPCDGSRELLAAGSGDSAGRVVLRSDAPVPLSWPLSCLTRSS